MKQVGKSQYLVVMGLVVACLASCAESITVDSLVGVYQINEKGKWEDFLRIDKKNNNFYLYENQNDRWSKDATLLQMSGNDEIEKLLKTKISVKAIGLSSKYIGVFRMPKGWKLGKFKTHSGYWAATMLGMIELRKK